MPTSASSIKKQLEVLASLYSDPPRPDNRNGHFVELVKAIISSQATSSGVAQVLPGVLSKYPDPRSMARAETSVLDTLLAAIPLHTQKAQNLVSMSELIVSRHAGEVPLTLEDLVRLPGVGRKIAQVYIARVGDAVSLPMNTHTHRVARRLGWTNADNMRHAESDVVRQLGGLVPPARLYVVAHHVTEHAKRACLPSRPRCGDCDLFEVCPSAGTGS